MYEREIRVVEFILHLTTFSFFKENISLLN
jgi:hypothetical protein